MNEKYERCYLCDYAGQVVEHPEEEDRKFYIKCRLDHTEHIPCSACMAFQEKLMEGKNGRTHSLEENH